MFKTSTLLAGLAASAIALTAVPASAENSDYDIFGPDAFVGDAYHAATMDVGKHLHLDGIVQMAQMVGTCKLGINCPDCGAQTTMAANDADAMVPMTTDGNFEVAVVEETGSTLPVADVHPDVAVAYGAADDVFDTDGSKGSVFEPEVALAGFAKFDQKTHQLGPNGQDIVAIDMHGSAQGTPLHFIAHLSAPDTTQGVPSGPQAVFAEFIAANATASGPDATGVPHDGAIAVLI